ncbi:MAG TPA: N-acetylmuramoyl-L-alanine amidase [Chitinophagaceae bacterium]|nr:N-acetylmuramoyl-L-alanine amidase [Chitinophagaceae bacterium]
MLRKTFFIISCTLILCVSSSFKTISDKAPSQQHLLRTIIVDAGHGGPDEGAVGEYSNEADITLAIALKLGKMLEDSLPDCKVVYTRTTHELPGGLQDHNAANRLRAKIANEAHGDLFVAIHVNDLPHPYRKTVTGYRTQTYYKGKGKSRTKHTRKVPVVKYTKLPGTKTGTETYIWAVGKNDQKKEFVGANEEDLYGEKADSGYQYFDNPEAKILASLRTQKYFNNSRMIAGFVQDELETAGRDNLGVKQRDWEGIWVLQATAMPSILVETGFICTPSEEDYLNSTRGQNETANCIYRAIVKYKQAIEGGGK